MAEDLDSRLLNRDTVGVEEEGRVAGRLRRDKRKRIGAEEQLSSEDEQAQPQTLRQQLMQAKRDGGKNVVKNKVRRKAEEKVFSPARSGTSRALRWAWRLLIPSWGLTLIYIDIHALMHFVVPDVFCDLGEEWSDGIVGIAGKEGEGAGVSETAKIVEKMLFIFVNAAAFFIIFLMLGMLALLAQIITNPIESLWSGLKMFAGLIVESVKGIINIL
jgi:hypothetical protein